MEYSVIAIRKGPLKRRGAPLATQVRDTQRLYNRPIRYSHGHVLINSRDIASDGIIKFIIHWTMFGEFRKQYVWKIIIST